MKNIFALLLVFFYAQQTQAQREAENWYFGFNAGVNFSTGAPVSLSDGALYTHEGSATISDPNGNLLFYTDGITIYNRNHLVMPNGTGLKGDPSSTQSAIIVPKSDEPNIYFVFTVDNQGGPNGLQYNIVDMSLDGGLGDVTAQKNIPLISPVQEKITAVAHANGQGIWVIAKSWGGNSYYSFLVDATGVNTTPVVTSIGVPSTQGWGEAVGYLKTSSDGSLLASVSGYKGIVELMHFNTATGTMSDYISLQDFFNTFSYDTEPYGVEFSLNNQVLYVTIRERLYQFDISSYDKNAIVASGLAVTPVDHFGALQMGPDGKLYVIRVLSRYLSVINDPDVLGLGCDYQEDVLYLGANAQAILGLPPFITSFFQVGIETENVCLGDTTVFNIDVSEPITSISWDFGDGSTSTLEAPSHTYAVAGDYTVTVSANTATDSFTDSKEITIYEIPVAYPVTDVEVCTETTPYEFNLSSKDIEVLGTQSAVEFQVAYYATLIDMQNGTNVLPNLYMNTNAIETLYARIYNVNNPRCFDTTSFDLVVQKAPIVNPQDDWTVCDTDLDGFYTFDLSQKTTTILTGNDASMFTVSYYESQADLDGKTNPIAINYTNTIAKTEIFFRIENNTYPTCYGEGTFFLEVVSGVTANTPTDFKVCDDDNDGVFFFDLSIKEIEIIGGQNAASVHISFHNTLLEAESGSNPVNKNAFINITPYSQTLFARVANNADSNCYDTTSLELQVSNSPVQNVVSDWQVCDADNDGIFSFDLSQKDAEIFGNQSATQFSVSYYLSEVDAQTAQNSITGNFDNTASPQNIFYRLENFSNAGCFLTDYFSLIVFNTPSAATALPIVVCDIDETGSYTFDLSQKDLEVLNGQDPSTYTVSYFTNETDATANQNPLPKTAYTNSTLSEVLFARVHATNLEACYAISNFEINIRELPQPDIQDTYVICPDSPELTIDGGAFESWIWRDPQNNQISTDRFLNVTALGDYTLTVTHSSIGLTCEKTVSFEVVSSGAPEDFTTEIENFSDQISIEVNASGIGDFEYSVDGENFQDSNHLEVFPGTYTVYVRDKFLCRTITKEVIALGYQKFFTPNGDGTHDYWNVIGVENFPESKVYIFDRQGKLLKQLTPDSKGWDGTFGGVEMPSSDYWFRFTNEDGNVFTGHFSLKR